MEGEAGGWWGEPVRTVGRLCFSDSTWAFLWANSTHHTWVEESLLISSDIPLTPKQIHLLQTNFLLCPQGTQSHSQCPIFVLTTASGQQQRGLSEEAEFSPA